MQKRLMDVVAALVADAQSPKTVQPGKRALHHPTVLAQLLAALNATPGNARRDAQVLEIGAVLLAVIALVGMEFARFPFWTPARAGQGGQGVHNLFEQSGLVLVGRR